MKLIKSSYSIIDQPVNLEDVYKQIEIAGRVCYKSEDKITENSAKTFVDKIEKLNHGSVLEHGTIYLKIKLSNISVEDTYFINNVKRIFSSNYYSQLNEVHDYFKITYYITTNYRVLIENLSQEEIFKLLSYICPPEENHEKRTTVKFITSIGIAREFIRHRVFSFSNESTRYCNYNRDKFNNEITFISTYWLDNCSPISKDLYITGLRKSEKTYLNLIDEGLQAQQAREVLPLCTKSELVMTGFNKDWKRFFELRDTKKAHPDAAILVHSLHEEFKQKNYL